MFQVHNRYTLATIAIGLCALVSSTGCRNCGGCGYNAQAYPPCNSVCGNAGAGIGAPRTVPSPETYSLQIPSAAGGGYYNRNAATANAANGLLQPRGVAPTPTTSGPNLAPQRGWREAGTTGTTSTSQYTPNNTNQKLGPNAAPQSVLASRSNASSVLNQGQTRVASATTQNGLSFRDNQNYSTTTVDERLDRTRLPATDATNVRAPVGPNQTLLAQNPYRGVAPANFVNPVAQSPVVVQDPRLAQGISQGSTYRGTPIFVGQPVYSAGQTRVANNVIPGRVEYVGQPVVYGASNFSQPSPQTYPGTTSSQPTVLAQSTVYSDPARATTTASNGGWRDSSLNGLNR